MPRPHLNPTIFLLPLILLLISSVLVVSDSVDDSYNKVKNIYKHIDLVTPEPYNVEVNSYSGVTYTGHVDYKYVERRNGTIYYHVAENGSGVFFFADGLPLISFTFSLDDIQPPAAWKEYTYTFVTMSHEQDDMRYLFLRIGIQPQGYPGHSNPGLYFEWGIMEYSPSAGDWYPKYVIPVFRPLYEGTDLRIYDIYVYIVPTFYIYIDEYNTTYLVFGFNARIKTRAENETSLGNSFTIGEVPYTMIPLRSGDENISIAKLEENIKQLYGWKIFVGMGYAYVFADQLVHDTIWALQAVNSTISVDFHIRNPTVYSILVDARKVNEYFELGVLTVLNEPVGRFQSNWTITDKETDLVAGILPLGIAFIPALVLRRYSRLGGAMIFLGLATFLMYMMFADVRIIILGAVSIASLFFIGKEGGGIG